MDKLKIEYVDINSIKPYKNNDAYCVYMHIFPNNKKYIGITSQNPQRRWRRGNGYKTQEMMTRAINKYGWDNIEHIILFKNLMKNEAEEKEIELINKYKTNIRKYGYNIEEGGKTAKGYHLSQKTREKMSKSKTGKNNWLYGKHLSEETKRKLSVSHKGKCNIEAIRKGAKKRMGANAFNARKVIQCDKKGNMILIHGSMAEAGRITNTRLQDIHNCCKGRQKTANGFIWKYYN